MRPAEQHSIRHQVLQSMMDAVDAYADTPSAVSATKVEEAWRRFRDINEGGAKLTLRGRAPLNPGDVAPEGTQGTGENICPNCGDTGENAGKPCFFCGGTGRIIQGVGG